MALDFRQLSLDLFKKLHMLFKVGDLISETHHFNTSINDRLRLRLGAVLDHCVDILKLEQIEHFWLRLCSVLVFRLHLILLQACRHLAQEVTDTLHLSLFICVAKQLGCHKSCELSFIVLLNSCKIIINELVSSQLALVELIIETGR